MAPSVHRRLQAINACSSSGERRGRVRRRGIVLNRDGEVEARRRLSYDTRGGAHVGAARRWKRRLAAGARGRPGGQGGSRRRRWGRMARLVKLVGHAYMSTIDTPRLVSLGRVRALPRASAELPVSPCGIMPKKMREFKNTLRVGCWSGRPHAAQTEKVPRPGTKYTHTTTPNHTIGKGPGKEEEGGGKGTAPAPAVGPSARPSCRGTHVRAEPSRPAWATTAEPRRCARRRPWVVRAASFAPALRVGPLDDHLADRRRHEWATGDGQSKRRGRAQSRLLSRQQKFSLTSHLSQQSRAFPACSAATRPSDGWWADWNHPPVTGSSMARSVGGALIPSPAMDSLTKGRRRAVHATH
ncbi:hypothetical protein PCL_00052 [Purpureocillium lilacinum]|uniref:Uncharacterized protein n=1 Tax=Purpureocillium lilacinum TaxID=33203 RepID=A0A2U3E5V4_PURLI|nr:hypothetical protein Purlil1_5750 [Purpureocillium lilacinum]PWI69908.1 hypothetical protein PCL_00052 [Purpureocillium lilacinum]